MSITTHITTILILVFISVEAHNVMLLQRVLHDKAEKVVGLDHPRHDRIFGIINFTVVGTFDDPVHIAGLYYTTINLGSPPKPFHVQIDTGSDVLWVNCRSCTNCPLKSEYGFEPNLYDPAASSSASALSCNDSSCIQRGQCYNNNGTCPFSTSFVDGSGAFGYYVTDLLHLDPVENSSAPIVFGCSTHLDGILTRENRAVDGIFGLSYAQPATITQLADKQIIPRTFSHCFGRDGRGVLILGEVKEATAAGIVYSPLVPSDSHYNLYLEQVTVNGKPLPVDPNTYSASSGVRTIVDTGTTYAYFVPEVYTALMNAINSSVSQFATHFYIGGGIRCYNKFNRWLEIFPQVSFNFSGNTSIILTPLDYIIHVQPIFGGDPNNCIAFLKSQDERFNILGDIAMKDRLFTYDIAAQRIGWKSYNCSTGLHVTTSSGVGQPSTFVVYFCFLIAYLVSLLRNH